jgi:hypothetical protein
LPKRTQFADGTRSDQRLIAPSTRRATTSPCALAGAGRATKIRGIEVVFAGNSDQGEQGIAPGIGQCGPIRWGELVSLTGQTGQSEAIHSPEACTKSVASRIWPHARSIAVVWTLAISCRPRLLLTISRPLASEA